MNATSTRTRRLRLAAGTLATAAVLGLPSTAHAADEPTPTTDSADAADSPLTAEETVVTRTRLEAVVPTAAVEHVAPGARVEQVVAPASVEEQRVRGRRARHEVVAGTHHDLDPFDRADRRLLVAVLGEAAAGRR